MFPAKSDLPQTLNQFSYAHNNPVLLTDPSGLAVPIPSAFRGGIKDNADDSLDLVVLAAASSNSPLAAAAALVPVVRFAGHALQQMEGRQITPQMVATALSKGQQFWDPRNRVINYVLSGGFASGKDLLVGWNPWKEQVTTAIRGADLIVKRFIPIP